MGKDDVGNARFMVCKPIQLWCNNTVAIHIANNRVFHVKTKHIVVDRHYVRGKVMEGIIDLIYISTKVRLRSFQTRLKGSKMRVPEASMKCRDLENIIINNYFILYEYLVQFNNQNNISIHKIIIRSFFNLNTLVFSLITIYLPCSSIFYYNL